MGEQREQRERGESLSSSPRAAYSTAPLSEKE